MGLGAALVMPSTLSVVLVVFPENERGKAIGIWAAMAGIGGPIGILVGGWAVENYDWQMVFLINVPFIIVALISGFFIIPKSKDETGRPLDILVPPLCGFFRMLVVCDYRRSKLWLDKFRGIVVAIHRHNFWVCLPILGE